jgi:hypothetical protein
MKISIINQNLHDKVTGFIDIGSTALYYQSVLCIHLDNEGALYHAVSWAVPQYRQV